MATQSVEQKSVLVLGGARSGKSRHAEGLFEELAETPIYIATAQAFDDEMRDRIAQHQRQRGTGWDTVEVALDLGGALEGTGQRPVLIDCLTLWLSNLILNEQPIDHACARLETALSERRGLTVLVSNEVGMGIVPDNALGREFRDWQGRLNQRMATLCDEVVFVAAGLPLTLKGSR